MAEQPNVVVTGFGAVTPLGHDAAVSWQNLLAGRDAEGPVDLFSTEGCRCRRAVQAQLPPLDLPSAALRRLSRASRLALPAAREALRQAGLLDAAGRSRRARLDLAVSTTAGGMALGEDFVRGLAEGRRTRLLRQAARYLPQEQVFDLQRGLGFEGPAFTVANACASGANAIGHGFDLIATGAADCVLAGGFEALTELVFAGFDCLQATTLDRCRPFDQKRSGLLLGEGAAFLVLEAEEHARRRGARPLARLAGYGQTTDYFHLTQPQPEGEALLRVMREAAGGLDPGAIGYVNAHGTGTVINDIAEALAYRAFFGDALPRMRISSTKAAIGHTLGAAGAVEAVFALQALLHQALPPQLNLREPLPELEGALALAPKPERPFAHTLSVNLGFGGSNAALLFSRHEA